MNKFTVMCCSVLMACSVQLANAQTSINAISSISSDQNFTSNFIDGISFTPEGILRTTESGGSKSIKDEEVPVVTKAAEASTSIEKLSSIQFKYAMML
ncbi:MAG TPA: hypothetical protein VJ279_10075, partial [Hanamia sp.]|nr:hypothetical protein [Hanamia sp.]